MASLQGSKKRKEEKKKTGGNEGRKERCFSKMARKKANWVDQIVLRKGGEGRIKRGGGAKKDRLAGLERKLSMLLLAARGDMGRGTWGGKSDSAAVRLPRRENEKRRKGKNRKLFIRVKRRWGSQLRTMRRGGIRTREIDFSALEKGGAKNQMRQGVPRRIKKTTGKERKKEIIITKSSTYKRGEEDWKDR